MFKICSELDPFHLNTTYKKTLIIVNYYENLEKKYIQNLILQNILSQNYVHMLNRELEQLQNSTHGLVMLSIKNCYALIFLQLSFLL